jgi:hypothetical protein
MFLQIVKKMLEFVENKPFVKKYAENDTPERIIIS